jgi:hypothetical protein
MQLDWLEIIEKLFDIAIIPILGAATVYLVTLIKAKNQELIDNSKSATVKKYIELLNDTIIECVLATNQTYVNALKEAGTFDAEAQKKAFQMTYDEVMAILSEDAETYLREAVKDLEAYITTKIESQIAIQHQSAQ